MYSIHFQNRNIEVDKIILRSSSMVGEKINAVFDNEEDLAYYAFFKGYYAMNQLSTICSYNDLYFFDGKKINDKGLDNIIEKYFPKEINKIKKRQEICRNKFVIMISNMIEWKLLKHWISYQKDIIDSMPEDKKKKLADIEYKSNKYIEEILPQNNNDINKKNKHVKKI